MDLLPAPALGFPGGGEWLIVLIAILLLFGAAAIPKLARSLGRAQGEFQKARGEFSKEVEKGRKEAGEATKAPAGATEEQIRATARDLGISENGMALADVKKAINERLA